MNWFFFAFLSALVHTIFNLTSKYVVTKVERTVYLGYLYSGTGLTLLLVSALKGFPTLESGFLLYVVIGSIIFSIGAYLWITALKEGDLSNTIPMLSFVPLFLVITSFLFLGERVSLLGFLGILGVVFGAYIVNSKAGQKGLLSPIKNLFTDKGPKLMLASAVFFAIGNSIDKIIILKSDPIVGAGLTQLFAGIFFLIISLYSHKSLKLPVKKDKVMHTLVASVFLYAGSVYTLNQAFALGVIPYAAAVKFLYVFLTVIAGILFFKEQNSRNRIIGSLIVVGSTVLLLFA